MSEICSEIQKKNTKIPAYADDVMFWTKNAVEFEENLNRLNNIGNELALKINLEKTVIQTISRNQVVNCIDRKGG